MMVQPANRRVLSTLLIHGVAVAISKSRTLLYDGRGLESEMLPDERTTHRNELPLPSEAEGLIVAPDRTIARPLVSFLRAQGLAVRTADDAETAFEEALL